MKRSNQKAPIVFYVGAILLCIWLVSSHLVGGLYARYSTTSTGNDSANVAHFAISSDAAQQSIPINVAVAPGRTEYTVRVTNSGNVSAKYAVEVTGSFENLPITIENPNPYIEIDPEEEMDLTIVFVWEVNTLNPESALDYMGAVDQLYLTFTATQLGE